MLVLTIREIDNHIHDIQRLFATTKGHRHEKNYVENPLFEHTKFAMMGWHEGTLVYYSAGIERPEYNGSIRIMSRHVRHTEYDFGGRAKDLKRGLNTLDLSTEYAINKGYKDIWVSREENPNLLYYFQKHSKYDWSVQHEKLHYGGYQWILRLV